MHYWYHHSHRCTNTIIIIIIIKNRSKQKKEKHNFLNRQRGKPIEFIHFQFSFSNKYIFMTAKNANYGRKGKQLKRKRVMTQYDIEWLWSCKHNHSFFFLFFFFLFISFRSFHPNSPIFHLIYLVIWSENAMNQPTPFETDSTVNRYKQPALKPMNTHDSAKMKTKKKKKTSHELHL